MDDKNPVALNHLFINLAFMPQMVKTMDFVDGTDEAEHEKRHFIFFFAN